MIKKRLSLTCLITAASAPLLAVPAEDGLYATIAIHQDGQPFVAIDCKLDYVNAPLPVANLIRLAEGALGWVDEPRATISTAPFYDGLLIHRVYPGFMFQLGSPTGTGSGGPGYSFPDVFTPSMSHNRAGLLSMANSGPNTNGSQFFILFDPAIALDFKHMVFGEVVAADLPKLDQVEAVQVEFPPFSSADTVATYPVLPLTIASIVITRQGAAALAFDEDAQGLPAIADAPSRLTDDDGVYNLHFTRLIDGWYKIYYSNELTEDWGSLGTISQVDAFSDDLVNISFATDGLTHRFFKTVELLYPSIPLDLQDRALTLNDGADADQYVFTVLEPERAGSSGPPLGTLSNTNTGENADVLAYLYGKEPAYGYFQVINSSIIINGSTSWRVSLVFEGPDSGSYTLRSSNTPNSGAVDSYGTFTLESASP